MKALADGYNYDDPATQITLDALNPNMGDGRLYALEAPLAPVPLAQPSPTDIVNAFDPSNKSSFSPLGVQNLYKVSQDYGYRAGVTDTSPYLPSGTPSASVPPVDTSLAPKLFKLALLGAVAYFAYEHFLKKHRG